MELEELIENTLRRKHLEEMMNRPEKEHCIFRRIPVQHFR